jgi:hypothetical protein
MTRQQFPAPGHGNRNGDGLDTISSQYFIGLRGSSRRLTGSRRNPGPGGPHPSPMAVTQQLVRAAGAFANAATGWLTRRLGIDHQHQRPLPPAVDAERRERDTVAGRVSYYIDQRAGGRPLLRGAAEAELEDET